MAMEMAAVTAAAAVHPIAIWVGRIWECHRMRTTTRCDGICDRALRFAKIIGKSEVVQKQESNLLQKYYRFCQYSLVTVAAKFNLIDLGGAYVSFSNTDWMLHSLRMWIEHSQDRSTQMSQIPCPRKRKWPRTRTYQICAEIRCGKRPFLTLLFLVVA